MRRNFNNMSVEVGSIVDGVVTGITNFGAFIELGEGKTGLVHISEVANTFVRDIKEFLKENDKVKVKVIGIDDKGKISLSIKQTEKRPPQRPPQRHERAARPPVKVSFEDKLTKFLKESDERQQDLKKSVESKRGGNSRRKSGG